MGTIDMLHILSTYFFEYISNIAYGGTNSLNKYTLFFTTAVYMYKQTKISIFTLTNP